MSASPKYCQGMGEEAPLIAHPINFIRFCNGKAHTTVLYGVFWVCRIIGWKLMFDPAPSFTCIFQWSSDDTLINVGQHGAANCLCQICGSVCPQPHTYMNSLCYQQDSMDAETPYLPKLKMYVFYGVFFIEKGKFITLKCLQLDEITFCIFSINNLRTQIKISWKYHLFWHKHSVIHIDLLKSRNSLLDKHGVYLVVLIPSSEDHQIP